jgi:hypothetical protein
MVLACYHCPGAYSFEVAHRFLKNFWSSGLRQYLVFIVLLYKVMTLRH